jgi:hypothetical protein
MVLRRRLNIHEAAPGQHGRVEIDRKPAPVAVLQLIHLLAPMRRFGFPTGPSYIGPHPSGTLPQGKARSFRRQEQVQGRSEHRQRKAPIHHALDFLGPGKRTAHIPANENDRAAEPFRDFEDEENHGGNGNAKCGDGGKVPEPVAVGSGMPDGAHGGINQRLDGVHGSARARSARVQPFHRCAPRRHVAADRAGAENADFQSSLRIAQKTAILFAVRPIGREKPNRPRRRVGAPVEA